MKLSNKQYKKQSQNETGHVTGLEEPARGPEQKMYKTLKKKFQNTKHKAKNLKASRDKTKKKI